MVIYNTIMTFKKATIKSKATRNIENQKENSRK